MDWPTARTADTFAPVEGREHHQLDVYLANGEVQDVRLDGESVWPTWFKVEWKGQGDLSAKVHGVRLSTRYGDRVVFHEGAPNRSASAGAEADPQEMRGAMDQGRAEIGRSD